MPNATQQGTETGLMTFRAELCCPTLMQKEGRRAGGCGPAQHWPLPRQMSRAVFQLTEPSLIPAASQSQGSIPTASDAPPRPPRSVTAKHSHNGAESWELLLEAS